MLEFRKPKLDDKAWIEKIMKSSNQMGCEFCFGNLYMWSAVYGNEIAHYNDLFFARDVVDTPMYLYPCGKGDKKKAIEYLIEHSKQNDGVDLQLYGLNNDDVKELDEMFPGKFTFEPHRDYFDYIYLTENLINLSGKKYHGKRNHISYFKKTFDWAFEKIDSSNIEECIAMNEKWEEINREKNPDELDNEKIAIMRAFDNFDSLNLVGGLLRANGDVVAYTIGEEINKDVFCTHIEKAFADVRGSYPTINQEFAKNMLSNYKYINREEDTGSEGLRKAKLSYNPTILLEKYSAKYEG